MNEKWKVAWHGNLRVAHFTDTIEFGALPHPPICLFTEYKITGRRGELLHFRIFQEGQRVNLQRTTLRMPYPAPCDKNKNNT
jgi:hypothetical protein